MPYILDDLVIDRVDFVDEGANSAAFIEVFKRKEQKKPMDFSEILSKLKPEHAEVIQQHVDSVSEELSKAKEDLSKSAEEVGTLTQSLTEANDALAKANEDLEKANAEIETLKAESGSDEGEGKTEKNTAFDEAEVLKSMPDNIREEYIKMRTQKEAAEEQVRKAAEEKLEAEAVAKAATLKALPVEQDKLVQIIKGCDPAVLDVLSAAAAAIEGTVLTEVGKSGDGKSASDAWDRIEAKADEIAKRDNVTKQRAIATAIKENPELYKEYLDGGK